MPKLKTHRGTAKRIRITANNKVLGGHPGKVHKNEKKSASRKRSLAGKIAIKGGIAKSLKRAIGE